MTGTNLLDRLAGIGAVDGEPTQARIERGAFVLATCLYGILGILWGSLYMVLGFVTPALIPYGYVVIAAALLVWLHLTARFGPARDGVLLAWLVLPLLLQISMGGFVAGSAVVLWSIAAPIGALFFSPGRATLWSVGFIACLLAAWAVEPLLDPAPGVESDVIRVFFAMNLAGVGVAVVLILRDFLSRLQQARSDLEAEKDRSERLLLNVLPEPIAKRLKEGEKVIADRLDEVSVVFADLVGFTSLADGMPADDVVDALDGLVADFDRIVEQHGMEKIRTMGDAYLAVAGAPRPREDHVEMAVRAAMEMLDATHRHTDPSGKPFEVRIGIDCGPVVAGVIGLTKFVYDVWGDTVNTASRMESHGMPGRIQVTERVYELLRESFVFEARGEIEVKGKGTMSTYLLLGPVGGRVASTGPETLV